MTKHDIEELKHGIDLDKNQETKQDTEPERRVSED
jgi:hypothetical protein